MCERNGRHTELHTQAKHAIDVKAHDSVLGVIEKLANLLVDFVRPHFVVETRKCDEFMNVFRLDRDATFCNAPRALARRLTMISGPDLTLTASASLFSPSVSSTAGIDGDGGLDGTTAGSCPSVVGLGDDAALAGVRRSSSAVASRPEPALLRTERTERTDRTEPMRELCREAFSAFAPACEFVSVLSPCAAAAVELDS